MFPLGNQIHVFRESAPIATRVPFLPQTEALPHSVILFEQRATPLLATHGVHRAPLILSPALYVNLICV